MAQNEWLVCGSYEEQRDPDWLRNCEQSRIDRIRRNEEKAADWEARLQENIRRGRTDLHRHFCQCFSRSYTVGAYRFEFVGIDLRTGRPVQACDTPVARGSAMEPNISCCPISWKAFMEIAKEASDEACAYYEGIGDDNWRQYLSPKMMSFWV